MNLIAHAACQTAAQAGRLYRRLISGAAQARAQGVLAALLTDLEAPLREPGVRMGVNNLVLQKVFRLAGNALAFEIIRTAADHAPDTSGLERKQR